MVEVEVVENIVAQEVAAGDKSADPEAAADGRKAVVHKDKIEVAVYGIEGVADFARIESVDTRGHIHSHSSVVEEGAAPAMAVCEAKPRNVNKDSSAGEGGLEVDAADE